MHLNFIYLPYHKKYLLNNLKIISSFIKNQKESYSVKVLLISLLFEIYKKLFHLIIYYLNLAIKDTNTVSSSIF